MVTYRQVGYWGDNVTIWAHTAQVTDGNFFAESSVGQELKKRGRQEEAVQHFLRALSTNPTDGESMMGVALYYHETGKLRESIPYYEKYLALPNEDHHSHYQALGNLGHVYRRLGDVERARHYFEEATKYGSQ